MSTNNDSSSSSSSDWCLIESDPGVFSELLETLGCTTVELDELWSLDDDSLQRLTDSTNHVYGLIFLFQWIGEEQAEHAANKEPKLLTEEQIPPHLFFAHQVTTNACATQAILSVVLNASSHTLSEQELGTTLTEFKSFSKDFPPNLKGVAISGSEPIKKAHNAFCRPDAFLIDDEKVRIPTGKEEAYHFIAYVPVNNTVYELDGLQKGPIVVGTLEEEDSSSSSGGEGSNNNSSSNKDTAWLALARTAIQERMNAGGDHIKFNLMAVVQDKRIKLQQQQQQQSSSSSSPQDQTSDSVVAQLASENAKREAWHLENQRRRHNYVPLCMQLLKELARAEQLPQLLEQAKERQANKKKE